VLRAFRDSCGNRVGIPEEVFHFGTMSN